MSDDYLNYIDTVTDVLVRFVYIISGCMWSQQQAQMLPHRNKFKMAHKLGHTISSHKHTVAWDLHIANRVVHIGWEWRWPQRINVLYVSSLRATCRNIIWVQVSSCSTGAQAACCSSLELVHRGAVMCNFVLFWICFGGGAFQRPVDSICTRKWYKRTWLIPRSRCQCN